MKNLILSVLTLFFVFTSQAQEKSKIKFGNVTAEDFRQTVYTVDSNASAVIIAEIGSTEFIGNNRGGFSLLYKKFQRCHILSKNGYDIANVEIPLYTNGQNEEQLENLKAVSYNLENGKVIETKLDVKESVFKDRISKNLVIKKFTFPNIKEGTIIEFEFRIKSDFIFNLQPWNFQGEYPRLWSEYNVAMPSFYHYVTLTQGYHPYFIKDAQTGRMSFNMADVTGSGQTERASFQANIVDYKWVMKDVPALKEESFTSTINNHISRIEFQLQSIGEPFKYQQVMASWDEVAKELMEDEDFGAQLRKDNGWLSDAFEEAAVKGSADEKARKIFSWVRDNFTCTNHNGTQLGQPLKNILKNKKGNVAEINLLLTAMLRKADIKAYPVLLSTRSHGYVSPIYPLMDRFNYIISFVDLEGRQFYLDASEPGQGFGKLGSDCYNGHARIIGEQALAVELDPSTIKEIKSTMVFLINDEKGKYVGSVSQTPGYFESYHLRNKLKEKGKESYSAELKKMLGDEMRIDNVSFDSLNKYEEPVTIHYDIHFEKTGENLIYLNPLLGSGFKDNPFKSATRHYPVEMPYAIDETFNVRMEIPAGYTIDELPKPMVIKYNEAEDAIYEYRISTSANTISFRSRIQIKKTYFQPEDYEMLREFFALIVKKQNEQIVFKKKTNP